MCGYEDIISMSVGIKVCYRLFLSLLGGYAGSPGGFNDMTLKEMLENLLILTK